MLTKPQTLRRAAVLAFGVTGFAHARHLGTAEPMHALTDGALALPLALVASWVGSKLRSRPAGAVATAGTLAGLLIPAAEAHARLHSAGASHVTPAFEAGFGHHVTDAVTAFPVAWLLAFFLLRARRSRLEARRLALASAVAVFAATLPLSLQPALAAAPPPAFSFAMPQPPELSGSNITLTADESEVPILSGATTSMWTYNGSFPGPTIRVTSGTPVSVTVQNRLDDAGSLTLHHHGNHSASADDGQPHDYLIAPGDDRTYTYELMEDGEPERPAMQWYHDHRMDQTARNVWKGLAGMVIVDPAPGDPEAALKLPSDAYDVPIMLADRTFDTANDIPYTFDSNGVQGNVILANGKPQPFFEVEPRRYRIRLLNASNMRAYLLSIEGMPMTQIGTESGLLPAPVALAAGTGLRLDPAERAEVVLDFTGRENQKLVLRNTLGFGPGLAQAMRFDVVKPLTGTDDSVVPATLRAAPDFGDAVAAPSLNENGDLDHVPRLWLLTQSGVDTPIWTINGQEFNHERVDASPVRDTIENWVFVNTTSVEHVVHIHDVDWRIVARTRGLPPGPQLQQRALEGIAELPLDPAELGLKESFLVRPFEVVEVAARFTDHLGRYVWHCHILEHEDRAMMAQFEVVAG